MFSPPYRIPYGPLASMASRPRRSSPQDQPVTGRDRDTADTIRDATVVTTYAQWQDLVFEQPLYSHSIIAVSSHMKSSEVIIVWDVDVQLLIQTRLHHPQIYIIQQRCTRAKNESLPHPLPPLSKTHTEKRVERTRMRSSPSRAAKCKAVDLSYLFAPQHSTSQHRIATT